ncbi:MAG: DUF6602 domain-containing protein [Hyphomicrobium sp.]|uniref:DUF6602 domain-containing protein n=1 Tax=Hyphomicrobium sp. TaxID=82 RepID=UPI003566F78E
MISDVADLLRELMAAEAANISKQGIKHAPTIGAMYEGLTKEILDRAIPPSLNLQVVNGFVEGIDGFLSPQIDCMLVTGNGRKLPHIDSYVWHIADVIAILEVKKNLYGAEMKDAILKQRIVYRMFTKFMGESSTKVDVDFVLTAFAKFSGRYISSYDKSADLKGLEKIVFHLMIIEYLAPVRIIFGYEGFATENSLRAGFVDFLESNIADIDNIGAFSIPNLIVASSNSLVKLNGFPYVAPKEGDLWNIVASNGENPIRILIELIWSRLENRFKIQLPEDANLSKERLLPLLRGKVRQIEDEKWGWIYEIVDLSPEVLAEFEAELWTPDSIETFEWAVAIAATENGHIDIRDEMLDEFARSEGVGKMSLINRLVARRILVWDGEYTLRPIAETLLTIFTPDGKVQISSNATLTGEWVFQNIDLRPRSLEG